MTPVTVTTAPAFIVAIFYPVGRVLLEAYLAERFSDEPQVARGTWQEKVENAIGHSPLPLRSW